MCVVLLIEVDELVRDTLIKALSRQGHDVEATGDVHHAMEWLKHNEPDVVMTELIVGHGTSGAMILEHVHRICPKAMKILMSGHPVLDSRVHTHAHDVYLAKPFSARVIASTFADFTTPQSVRAA